MSRLLTEPLISVQLDRRREPYLPGDVLTAEYQIDAVDAADVRAVELSVLWYTEGKGDMAVHYFERLAASDNGEMLVGHARRFSTRLPNSPLSYDGLLVKIRWCVRVRVFVEHGKDPMAERGFTLGRVPRPALSRPRPTPEHDEAASAPARSGAASAD
jgi:hypothetical protein